MKRKWIGYLAIVIIVFVIFSAGYLAAWQQVNSFAIESFKHSESMEKVGKYVDALNGYQIFDKKLRKYITWVGYVQISKMFEGFLVFSKPAVVQKAKKKIMHLISNMSLSELERYFNMTVRSRNPYILYVTAELIKKYENLGNNSKVDMYKRLFAILGGKPEQIDMYYQRLHREADK